MKQNKRIEYIRVIDHERYQSYQQTNPTWVKLHRSLLDSYRYRSLNDPTKYLFLGLIIAQSWDRYGIPNDKKYLRDMLGIKSKTIDIQALVEVGLIELVDGEDQKNFTGSNKKIVSETETETEKRREDPKKCKAQRKRRALSFDFIHYDEIRDAFKTAHPKSDVKKQSACEELSKIETIDGYRPDEIRNALIWCLTKEPQGEGFTWRKQIKSIHKNRLRTKCKNGASKFQNIYDAWQESQSKTAAPGAGLEPWQLEARKKQHARDEANAAELAAAKAAHEARQKAKENE